LPETGEQTEEKKAKKQRVACPGCGRIFFDIDSSPEETYFRMTVKCKAGGCHRFCRVTFDRGALTVCLA
jgi:hypothetical protein